MPHLQGKLDQEQRAALIERGKGIKDELEGLEARLEQLELELQREGQRLPNMTHPGHCCPALLCAVLCCTAAVCPLMHCGAALRGRGRGG